MNNTNPHMEITDESLFMDFDPNPFLDEFITHVPTVCLFPSWYAKMEKKMKLAKIKKERNLTVKKCIPSIVKFNCMSFFETHNGERIRGIIHFSRNRNIRRHFIQCPN